VARPSSKRNLDYLTDLAEADWDLDLSYLFPEKAPRKKAAPKPPPPTFAVRPNDPAFQKWFGQSKVVDPAGAPLRVFHGTSKDDPFEAFRVDKRGAWFTKDPAYASEYAAQNDSMNLVPNPTRENPWGYRPVNTASRVIPTYLSFQNPLVVPQRELHEMAYKLGGENYSRGQGLLFDKLRQQGYDGIIADDTFVALGEPGQIKSAISNTGAFDPRQKNVKKAHGGLAVKRKAKRG
jgi:hypothetical protein